MEPELGQRNRIAACEPQPVTAEGLRRLVESTSDLEWAGCVDRPELVVELVWRQRPRVLVADKGLGLAALVDSVPDLRDRRHPLGLVVWAVSFTPNEALRCLQAGCRGIVRKCAPLEAILACVRSVAAGSTWMEDWLWRETAEPTRCHRAGLTPREHQIAGLIAQGLTNKAIGRELGISPGTVKIHLRHIFEKTGLRGRTGLTLAGLRENTILPLWTPV